MCCKQHSRWVGKHIMLKEEATGWKEKRPSQEIEYPFYKHTLALAEDDISRSGMLYNTVVVTYELLSG